MTHLVDLGSYQMPVRRDVPTCRIADIVTLASEISDVPERDILSDARFRHIVRVRQACYLVARESGHSYPRIARPMGREHSSVMYGARIAVVHYATDSEFAALVDELRARARACQPFVLRKKLVAQFMAPASMRVEQRGMVEVAA